MTTSHAVPIAGLETVLKTRTTWNLRRLLQPLPPLPPMLGLQVHATTKRQEARARPSRRTLMRLAPRVRNSTPPWSGSSSSHPRTRFYSEACNSKSPREEACAQNSCKGGRAVWQPRALEKGAIQRNSKVVPRHRIWTERSRTVPEENR